MMIDSRFIADVRTALTRELVRRQLNRYFIAKGFSESFDNPVHPPILMDIAAVIPELMNRVELSPSSHEIDPTTGVARIDWNLFVLGNNRMYLGRTVHTSLAEIQMAMQGASKNMTMSEAKRTPREIIDFILKMLDQSETGYQQIPADVKVSQSPGSPLNRPMMGPTASGGYYERNKPA